MAHVRHLYWLCGRGYFSDKVADHQQRAYVAYCNVYKSSNGQM